MSIAYGLGLDSTPLDLTLKFYLIYILINMVV